MKVLGVNAPDIVGVSSEQRMGGRSGSQLLHLWQTERRRCPCNKLATDIGFYLSRYR